MAVNQITPPSFNRPLLEQSGIVTAQTRFWMDYVTLSIPIVGSGSPEGVVEARVRQLYMNSSGATGAVLYIKRDIDDGSGDKTVGWILV